MKQIRSSIKQLKHYFVIQDPDMIKLNQNESPFDIPEELKNEIWKNFQKIEWNRYPAFYPKKLIDTISGIIDYPSYGIVAGNGSSELIQITLASFCSAGDTVSLITPGFLLYSRIAAVLGLEINSIPLKENFKFDVESIIENSQASDILVLINPNNPTGTVLNYDETEEIIKNLDIPIILDEAYYEFYDIDTLSLLHKYENLMIIRTFSKALGLAGLRIGYLLAKPEYADHIEKAKLIFTVDSFQQIAGELMFTKRNLVKKAVETIKKERNKVFDGLKNIKNIKPVPSHTNFIFFKVKGKSAAYVTKKLEQRKILVRYAPKPVIEDYIRVTIGTSEENDIFLKNLTEIMEKE
ncbi:MAG: histidinol-phosphate transaminase [bacterium]